MTILGKKGVPRWGWSSWGHHTRVDGISFLPRVLPLNVLLGVEHRGVEGQGGPLAFLLPLWTFTRPVSDFDQVCSIPHSYHVSFSQSKINVEKCAFSFLTQDQCLRQLFYWCLLGPQCHCATFTTFLFLCSSVSYIQAEVGGP